MHNVCTFEACESVREAAGSQGHEGMLHVLMSVTNNLTAAEAKYHKTCFVSYVIKSNLKHEKRKQKQFMTRYSKRWRPKLVKVYIYIQEKAYDVSPLLLKYRERLKDKGIKAESCRKQRLKLRLEKHFGENIVFYQHSDRSKPEVIYSSDISLQDVLNVTVAQKAGIRY